MQNHWFSIGLKHIRTSDVFSEHRILNGAGATSTFRKQQEKANKKMLTARGPQQHFVKILNGMGPTATFRMLRKIENG